MSVDKNSPPVFSLRLIRLLCRDDLHEELEGNLYEFYTTHNNNFYSRLAYWYEVLKYLRPSTLRSFTKSKKGSMFIFNPLLIVRNLARQGSSTFINLGGFTIGLVCVFFLYFYVSSELSTDSFHKDGSQIYRAIRMSEINGTPYKVGVTSGPYAAALATDFPEAISDITRAMPDNMLVSYGDKKFMEDYGLLADANFFTFFSFPLKEGLPGEVLRQQNSIVLSEALAKKYFGDADPIGQTLLISGTHSYMVTGIMGEWPARSHLKFDFVIPITRYEKEEWFKSWWNNSLVTYLKIATPEIAANVNGQLSAFIDKHMGEHFKVIGTKIDLGLEPLNEIYFNNETRYDPSRHGDMQTLYILGLVGAGILFIACFNYVNLSIAQSFRRAKEVGIRKVLGGDKSRLVLQFIGESLIVVTGAVAAAVFLSILVLPWLNNLFELEVAYSWTDGRFYLFLAALAFLIMLLSSIYPAVLLSRFNPVSVLKGKKMTSGANLLLRKGLVLAQFAISICMIAFTLLVLTQINFMAGKELGFNKEAVFILQNNYELRPHGDAFVQAIRSHRSIEGVSFSAGEPGGFHDATVVEVEGLDQQIKMRIVSVDEHYLNVYNIPLVAGRNFSEEYRSEEEMGVILNEKALEDLGLQPEDAIGRMVSLPGWLNIRRRIVGVVANYHFSSLRDSIEPLVLLNSQSSALIAVRIKPSMLQEGIEAIDATYAKFAAAYPMIGSFLDDRLDRQYVNEKRQSKVFTSFALVSVLLASLGILGLASFTAQQRQKEFGIRKVLGASGSGILQLISREYMLLIAGAFGLAVPVSWYFIDGWLDGFAYRIALKDNLHLFLLSGLLTGIIALFTITVKTYRSAVANPIESIRYE